jgi:hypothetical protein
MVWVEIHHEVLNLYEFVGFDGISNRPQKVFKATAFLYKENI